MGATFAHDLAGTDLDIRQQLAYHLQGNHYPPVPVSMVGPCLDAIDACNDEDYQRLIELPEGVYWRGETSAPASAIAEAHHLDSWINHAHYCDCEECMYFEDEE